VARFPPRTIFRDIVELPPAITCWPAMASLSVKGYWEPTFPSSHGAANAGDQQKSQEEVRGGVSRSANRLGQNQVARESPVGATGAATN